VFVKGRVTLEEDKPAKLICSSMLPFDDLDKELWIQCRTKEEYLAIEENLFQILAEFDGRDEVHIYLSEVRAAKRLPNSRATKVCPELLEQLYARFGSENVKVVEKSIEKKFLS
jgi:DNA polymerase-3 subunit alpha